MPTDISTNAPAAATNQSTSVIVADSLELAYGGWGMKSGAYSRTSLNPRCGRFVIRVRFGRGGVATRAGLLSLRRLMVRNPRNRSSRKRWVDATEDSS
jgi:hypothetical protein